jgi:hypothetical protein
VIAQYYAEAGCDATIDVARPAVWKRIVSSHSYQDVIRARRLWLAYPELPGDESKFSKNKRRLVKPLMREKVAAPEIRQPG